MTLASQLKQLEWKSNGYLTPLVTILGAIQALIFLPCFFMPSVTDALYINCDNALEVWRFLTYGLTHYDIIHFALNMFTWVMLGSALERREGWRPLLILIVIAIVVGAGVHILTASNPAVGFSGALFAVLIVFVARFPKALFFGFLPAWLLAAIVVGINFLLFTREMTAGIASNTAYGIHLAGAGVGALWAWGQGTLRNMQRSLQQAQATRQEQRDENDQAYLDELLEKVSREGLPGLTASERKFLEKYRQRQLKDH
jgi:membrane associated rhomboid family serine protease